MNALLEIGVEHLPSRFMVPALAQLEKLAADLLTEKRGRRNDLTAVLNAVLDVINTAARNARGKNPCLRLRNDPKRYVNFPDYYGRTALWYAVDRNHENVVGILLKNNAEVDWR